MNDMLRLIQEAKDMADASRFALACVVVILAVGILIGYILHP